MYVLETTSGWLLDVSDVFEMTSDWLLDVNDLLETRLTNDRCGQHVMYSCFQYVVLSLVRSRLRNRLTCQGRVCLRSAATAPDGLLVHSSVRQSVRPLRAAHVLRVGAGRSRRWLADLVAL